MTMLTVRNLPDEVHRALKARAARRHHSMEAEVREILASVVADSNRLKLGSRLAAIGREAGLDDADAATFDRLRDKAPARKADFS